MIYTIETPRYNDRRYGKPWIAEVSGKDFRWGNWIGRPGEPGRLEIEAEPGSLIASGQKDIRKGRGGVDTYWLALPDGELYSRGLSTEVKARDWYKAGWQAYAEWRISLEDEPKREAFRAMLGLQSQVAMADFF